MDDKTKRLIARALRAAESSVTYGTNLTSPVQVADYLKLRVAGLEYEVFGAVWLTSQHSVIETQELFRGTIGQTSVYPREVVKAGLAANAAACVLFHNHPSGAQDPSRADEHLTQTLKTALALVDIRVLDHLVLAGSRHTSFAERGLI